MQLSIRRRMTIIDEKWEDAGQRADIPLRKVAVIAVLRNPYIGHYEPDLSPLIDASRGLGEQMARDAIAALGEYEAQSYGKGGLVGTSGEQEHANALLTTAFANPFRDAIGGATAWISSMTKVVAPGVLLDVPMNSKNDVYVRSHYDGMSIVLPDAPMPDEIAIVFCLANRGRLNARVGGLRYEEAQQRFNR